MRIAIVAALGLLTTVLPGQDQHPNVLFLFSDDHAPHAISAYGSMLTRTPNIDRIANEGMRFDRCVCGNSICAPSRATILTGKHSHLNGVIDNNVAFDGSQQAVHKILQQAGYTTAMIGKWHLKSEPQGFDHFEVLWRQGPYYNPKLRTANGDVPYTGYTTDIITERGLHWLQEGRDKKKPFMLFLQHKSPHRHWQPPPRMLNLLDNRDLPYPPTLWDNGATRASGFFHQEMTVHRHLTRNDLKLTPQRGLKEDQRAAWDAAYGPKNEQYLSADLEGEEKVRWMYQRYIKDYLRTIAAMDEGIGRVLDYLDQSGLTKNTIVIYSSDQGFYLGDHGFYDKRWMYEESFRMPLLVRWPKTVKPGTSNSKLVQNIDFAPTFLDMAGLKSDPGMQGRSMVPILTGRTPADWRNSVYYHYYESYGAHHVPAHVGVATERYKLMHYYELDEWEFFDLKTDPQEIRNRYGDPAAQDLVAQLKKELRRLQARYQDDHGGTLLELKADDPRRVAGSAPIQEVLNVTNPVRGSTQEIALEQRSFAVEASISTREGDGVVLAHGGEKSGHALHVRNGHGVFILRRWGHALEVATPDPLPMQSEAILRADLDAWGVMRISVGGREVAKRVCGLMNRAPSEPLSFGTDAQSQVASGPKAPDFPGVIHRVRIFATLR